MPRSSSLNRHKDDAKLTAVRARTHADAQREGNAYIRAAMSCVVFSAELLSGNLSAASRELDDLERHVNSAADEAKAVAVAKGKHAHKWAYQGIRRSIEAMQDLPNRDSIALLTILTFVESNGQEGGLEDMRRLVGSQLPKGSPLLTEKRAFWYPLSKHGLSPARRQNLSDIFSAAAIPCYPRHSSPVANRAPSANAANLSQATLGWISLNLRAEAANPQSAPAMTSRARRSWRTARSVRRPIPGALPGWWCG